MEEISEERSGEREGAPVDDDPSTAPVPEKVRPRRAIDFARALRARVRARVANRGVNASAHDEKTKRREVV